MADAPLHDNNLFTYMMAAVGGLFTIGAGAAAQLHARSGKIEERLRAEIAAVEKLTRDGDAAIQIKMDRTEEMARTYREHMLTNTLTKKDGEEINARLSLMEQRLLDAMRANRKTIL